MSRYKIGLEIAQRALMNLIDHTGRCQNECETYEGQWVTCKTCFSCDAVKALETVEAILWEKKCLEK